MAFMYKYNGRNPRPLSNCFRFLNSFSYSAIGLSPMGAMVGVDCAYRTYSTLFAWCRVVNCYLISNFSHCFFILHTFKRFLFVFNELGLSPKPPPYSGDVQLYRYTPRLISATHPYRCTDDIQVTPEKWLYVVA